MSGPQQGRLTVSSSKWQGKDAQPKELLMALLAQQQQHLQMQMQQVLNHHHAKIVNMVAEKVGHSLQTADENGVAVIPECNVAAVAPAEAAAAEAAVPKTTSGDTPGSGNNAPLKSSPKPKGKKKMAALVDGSLDPNPSSLQEIVSHFMHGRIAQGAVATVILVNTLVMYVQLQWLGDIANASLKLDNNIGAWGPAQEAFNIFEIGFGLFFILELLLNVYALRWEYFQQAFNVVDCIVVLITSVEVFLLQAVALEFGNISFLRMLRLAKFAKALRVVRTMTLFSKLRILLTTIYYSMQSLFWSMILMVLLMLMGATFLCQMLHDFVVDEQADFATRMWVNDRFGSGNKALYTFFEMTFSGGWPLSASRVVKDVSPSYAIFFVVYVTFVIFGMIRIISALFLSETLRQASRDTEIMVYHSAEKAKRLKREIGELFDVADTSGDGKLSPEELAALLSHGRVRAWLAELGINATDTQMLFDLLDDGDGEIDRQEFVDGITKLKGEARAQDLVPVATNVQRILAHCKVLRHTIENMPAYTAHPPMHPLGPNQLLVNI